MGNLQLKRGITIFFLLSIFVGLISFPTSALNISPDDVIEEIEQMKEDIRESSLSDWRWPPKLRQFIIIRKLNRLQGFIQVGNLDSAYEKLLRDIKPKLTGLRTDEYEDPWCKRNYRFSWIINPDQQEEFRIQCNYLLEWIILAGQYDDDTTPPVISITHYGGEGHQEDPGYWSVTVADLESGVAEVEIIIDGTTYLHSQNLNGVQSITYTDIPISLEEIISIGIHTIKVIARNHDFDTDGDQEGSSYTTGINIEAPPN